MARRVEYEGKTYEFPDDAKDSEITDFLEAQKPQAATSPNPKPRRTTRQEAAALGAVDGLGLGLADELGARSNAIGRSLSQGNFAQAGREALGIAVAPFEAFNQATGISKLLPTPTYNSLIQTPQEIADRQTFRGLAKQAQTENPLSYGAGALGGGLLTSAVTAPASVSAQGARLGGRMAQGAATGAAYGGVYGFNSGEGDQRQASMTQGAAVGAGVGAAAPVVLSAAAPIVRRGAEAFNRLPTPQPNALGMSIGVPGQPMRAAPRTAAPRRDATAQTLATLADRNKLTSADLAGRIEQAAADPRGRVAAELFGEPGIRRARTIAELPGETADLAASRMEQRTSGQLQRLLDDIDNSLGSQEAATARADLAQQYEAASRELYRPILARPINRDGLGEVQAVLARLPDSVKSRIDGLVQRLVQYEGTGQPPSEAQQLHYLKMALDDTIASMKREGLGPVETRALMKLKADYLQALDNAIPGYQQARQTWSGIADAEEAFDMGAALFTGSKRPDETAAFAKTLTDSQRAFFRSGVRDGLKRALSMRDAGGDTNVALALKSTEKRNVLKAALGEEEAAAIIKALDAEKAAFKNAVRMTPGKNSISTPLAVDIADQIASENLPRSTGDLINRGVGLLTSPFREQQRNALGRALYEPVDPASPDYNPERLNALLRALQEAEARRRGQTIASQRAASGAAGGGIGQQR